MLDFMLNIDQNVEVIVWIEYYLIQDRECCLLLSAHPHSRGSHAPPANTPRTQTYPPCQGSSLLVNCIVNCFVHLSCARTKPRLLLPVSRSNDLYWYRFHLLQDVKVEQAFQAYYITFILRTIRRTTEAQDLECFPIQVPFPDLFAHTIFVYHFHNQLKMNNILIVILKIPIRRPLLLSFSFSLCFVQFEYVSRQNGKRHFCMRIHLKTYLLILLSHHFIKLRYVYF